MTTKAKTYTGEETKAWDRVKKALANDWEQTKSDFGSKTSRDMDQDVDDTFKQMMGSDDAFENHEQAFRFGYTAYSRHHGKHPEWNRTLEDRLRDEYDGDYKADRGAIRYAYQYGCKNGKC